jgi:hypothetical protein
MPIEITFMDTEEEHKKYGTLRLLRYIYLNPFRFPISYLGLPNIPSQKAESEHWQNIPLMLEHQPDRIQNHNL